MSEFHIHVDAKALSPHLVALLENLGFWRSDFADQPEESYAPLHHFTLKPKSTVEFKEKFSIIEQWLDENPGNLDGYLEGEVVPADEEIAEKEFDSSIPIPFIVEMSRLRPGEFRESEIHVTLDLDKSHPTLRKRLREMGLFSAYVPKQYGLAEIFTAQGSQSNIDKLFPALMHYLRQAGGAVRCSVKEERIARWWISQRDLPLPPVVSAIKWRE